MTMQTGSYASAAFLSVARGTTFPAVPANFYLAAFTTMPTHSDGTGAVEVSGNAYARVALPTNTGTWGAPALQGDNVTEKIASVGATTFAAASGGNWGTILGVGIYDASTVGNLWAYGTLNASVVINNGNQLSIPASDLTWQLA